MGFLGESSSDEFPAVLHTSSKLQTIKAKRSRLFQPYELFSFMPSLLVYPVLVQDTLLFISILEQNVDVLTK